MKIVQSAGAVALALVASAAQADEGGKYPVMPEAMKAFHDVMRVDWHADKGAARNAAACANVGRYIQLSSTIGRQTRPSHVAASSWQPAVTSLTDAAVALGAYCGSAASGNVEAGLTTLHDRFHDLMNLVRKPAG